MPWLSCATGEALTWRLIKRGINTLKYVKTATMLSSVARHKRDVKRTPDVLAFSRVIPVKLLDYGYITMSSLNNATKRAPQRHKKMESRIEVTKDDFSVQCPEPLLPLPLDKDSCDRYKGSAPSSRESSFSLLFSNHLYQGPFRRLRAAQHASSCYLN